VAEPVAVHVQEAEGLQTAPILEHPFEGVVRHTHLLHAAQGPQARGEGPEAVALHVQLLEGRTAPEGVGEVGEAVAVKVEELEPPEGPEGGGHRL